MINRQLGRDGEARYGGVLDQSLWAACATGRVSRYDKLDCRLRAASDQIRCGEYLPSRDTAADGPSAAIVVK